MMKCCPALFLWANVSVHKNKRLPRRIRNRHGFCADFVQTIPGETSLPRVGLSCLHILGLDLFFC